VKTALLAALVVALALLTGLRPGRDESAAAAPAKALVKGPPQLPALDAAVQAREVGSRALAIAAVRKARTIDVQVTVVGPDALGVDGLRLRVGSPAKPRRTKACGPGCYGLTVRFHSPLTLVVLGMGKPQRFAFGKFPRPNADTLLRKITRAFRARKSVEYTERLASSPVNAIHTTYVLQRPDRLHFHVRGGHEAIIIGGTRWDRDPGRSWVSSPQTTLRQPTPAWRTTLTNAHVLGTTRTTYTLTFIDETSTAFPGWFELLVDRKTLLPKTLTMTAAAHFMRHVYTRYDRAPPIRPPRTG
jgi:hypothetical protein